MLKNHSHEFLKDIIKIGETNVNRLCALLELNKKQFWYKLSLLNSELDQNYKTTIECQDDQLQIDDSLEQLLKDVILDQTIPLFELQQERIYILYLLISSKDEFLSTAHFRDFFDLSRNAIMLDLRKLREWTDSCQVEVVYSRSNGYDLSGKERNIRRLMEESISKLKETIKLEKILKFFQREWDDHVSFEELTFTITELLKKNRLQIVFDRMEEFIFLTLFIIKRSSSEKLAYEESETALLSCHPLYHVAEELSTVVFDDVITNEVYFIESRLLGVIQGDHLEPDSSHFLKIVDQIIYQLQALIHLGDEEVTGLKKTLYQHIVPAYYRLIFDVYYSNPLLDKIKKDYFELFELTKLILKPLEQEIQKTISESEIAYFTIHFGGYISKHNVENQAQSLRAVLVCPNGISSSLIMSSTIKETFPEIEIINVYSSSNLSELNEDSYDMIFSTTYFMDEKKVYTTSPLLNSLERDILREQVSSDFSQLSKPNSVQVRELVKIIEKHTHITNKEDLIADLNHYIYRREAITERGLKNLTELMDKSLIKISDETLDWRGAIREASKALLEKECINEEYVQAMIETVEDIGPYIVLAPQVAVPHARPEKGVNKLGISLLKLNNEVDFNVDGEDDPDRYVKLVFVLAAVDGEAHLKALMQLSKILDDEGKVDKLVEIEDVDALYDQINKFIEGEE